MNRSKRWFVLEIKHARKFHSEQKVLLAECRFAKRAALVSFVFTVTPACDSRTYTAINLLTFP